MISGQFDRPKLEKSLKKFARKFGDNNAQAIARWGVQVCRELAFETQPYGKAKTKQTQQGAIIKDAYNVILIKEKLGKSDKKALRSPDEVNGWIESNRTRRNRRTAKLPISERRVCTKTVFQKAMKIRLAKAGMAKGAWIGTGQEISSYQTGGEKITIGKTFLSWTQKHTSMGAATRPMPGFFSSTRLSNKSAHSSSSYVLSEAKSKKAIDWGLKKTVKWYQKTLKAQDNAQKV